MSNMSTSIESSRFRRVFKLHDFDLTTPVTSHFVSPKTLLIVRTILATYTIIIVLTTFIISFPDPLRDYFAYFTHLSYLGLTVYLCAAVYHSFRYYRQGDKYLVNSRIANSSFALFVYWLAYHTVVVYHIVVPVIYWGTIYRSDITMTNINWWTTTSCHGLDFVFMFIEFSLSRWVLKVPYLILVLFISVTYMFWAWIIYAIYNNWVYGFLDWYRPTGAVLGGYLGVTAAFVVVCFFMYGLHYTREYIARRFFPQEKSADFCVIDTGSKECVEVNI